jgi:hypothetical protein
MLCSDLGRREFLHRAAGAGLSAAGALVWPSAVISEEQSSGEPLPTITLGKRRVTRLIVGGNPIGGFAYAPPKLTQHMLGYFTVEHTTQLLLHCEIQGITTFQCNYSPVVRDALLAARKRGSKMQFILLASGFEKGIPKEALEMEPIAICHHGGVTDTLLRAGKDQEVHDFVKRVHDAGFLAGVSTHNPDHLARVEDAGWENDFYMTCFYKLTRTPEELQKLVSEPTVDRLYFFRQDPERMTRRIQEVKKPCLAFKILAAGRLCGRAETLDKAFAFAYQNIKPTDAVIVGMYPVFSDEAQEDAQLARKYGKLV